MGQGTGCDTAQAGRGRYGFVAVDLVHPEAGIIELAADLLSSGEALVFPTDTVYGIGVAVADGAAPDLLFEIKRRDRSKAIPWLVPDAGCLEGYGRNVRRYCFDMVGELWPGPLTLVVEAGDAVPRSFCGAGQTIALRMPDSPVALAIMHEIGSPLATTSANVSGCDAINDPSLLDPRIAGLVPMVLDGGTIAGGCPSTVVSCIGPVPEVLREGSISAEQVMGFARGA